MEQCTPLDPLDDIISALPMDQQAPPLRTRALVQIFKQQYEGAAHDLTSAIRITEEVNRLHKPDQQQLELASRMREEQRGWDRGHRDRRSVPHLREEDQPKSLDMQLYFNRGGVYLTIACQSVHAALNGLKEYQEAQDRGGPLDELAQAAHALRLEARKRVKTNAKRALKDYSQFLSNFDYTPGLPFEITNEIMRRVYDLANGNKIQSPLPKNRLVELDVEDDEEYDDFEPTNGQATNDSYSSIVKHENHKLEPFERGNDGWPRFPSSKIHPASSLFAEKPPADLPPFPRSDTSAAMLNHDVIHEAFSSREAVTYHPLLTDALHSLLLAHALLQTSPTELLRHAHNAARLARIADGYPIFQAARSPARADWIEVLRRANNWLGLSVPWQKLCAPAPLPDAAGGWAKDGGSGVLAKRSRETKGETIDQKRERIKQESIIDALSDDRVIDEESFQRAVRARERRAMEDEQGISGPLKDRGAGEMLGSTASTPSDSALSASVDKEGSPTISTPPSLSRSNTPLPSRSTTPASEKAQPGPKRWAQDANGKEYPISTERAEAIARWIKEAPLSMLGPGKKKRPARKKKPASNGVHGVTAGVNGLAVPGEEVDGPD
nr:hypothetical protein CFP56_00708 [Quercus suber]